MTSPAVPRQVTSTFVYLGTIAFTQLASFALLPILTRFLEPAAYGEYAVALAIGSLIGMFGSSWIRNVGFRFYFDAREDHTTRAFFASLVLLQALVVIAVFGASAAWLGLAANPRLSLGTLGALAAMVLTSDLQTLTVAFLRAEQLSGRYALAEGSAAVTRVLGTTAGLLIGLRSPAFLFLAAAGAAAIGSTVALLALHRRLEGPLRIATASIKQVARLAPSALPFSVGEWLNSLSSRLILDWLSTAAVVGVFSAGQSLGNRGMAGIVQAVFMMAWPDVLDAWSEGGARRARAAVTRYITIFLMLTVGPVVALVLYASTLALLLGEAYRGSVDVIAVIAVATWARGLQSCFNRHFELNKRFGALSAWTLAGAAVNVGLTFLLVPRYLGMGAALAALASQALLLVAFIVVRDRELVAFPWVDAGLVAAATLVAAAVAWPLFGASVTGLLVFALTYLALVGALGLRRLRRL